MEGTIGLVGEDPGPVTVAVQAESTAIAPIKGSASNEIARVRAEVASNGDLTRADIVQMFLDAGSMAKLTGEASSLVAAARELGKLLGFYAPEVKKTLVGVDEATLKKVLNEMDDDELHRLANARVIDGESVRLL